MVVLVFYDARTCLLLSLVRTRILGLPTFPLQNGVSDIVDGDYEI